MSRVIIASPRLVVIVLNFRTPDVTIDCLRTLADEQTRFPGFRVVLIDNASGDNSVETIGAAIAAEQWDSWLEFRALDKNLGFAGGNNLILREQLSATPPPDYLLLLNSDTLVRPGCLKTCIDAMDADPTVGAMSCMLLNKDGSVQNVCRKFPRPDREGVRAFGLPWIIPALFAWGDLEDAGWDRRGGARDVEWIGGAFLLARSDALQKSGVFDETFFFYGEDCELCHRIWKAGYRVRFDPASETVHLGGASSDAKRMRNRTKDLLTWKARFAVQRKCYGAWAEWLSRGCYATMFALRLARLALLGGPHRDADKWQQLKDGLVMVTGRLES